MVETPPPLRIPRRDWFSRNWIWFVPLLCLVAAAFLAGIFAGIFGLMRSSAPYRESVARARANPAVVTEMGAPIREGWFMSGNIQLNGASGHATLAVPLKGAKSDATLYVVAQKSAGVWHYDRQVVIIAATRHDIDLREKK